MSENCLIKTQNTQGKNLAALLGFNDTNDHLRSWMETYFEIEVTTLPSSRKIQVRDLSLFLAFMLDQEGTDTRSRWTPRLSAEFKRFLTSVIDANGKRRWGDKTANRILAHLKTFAKWIHKINPFPLGNPMEKIKGITVGNSLEIDRAITPSERRRLLDAADLLAFTGGKSKDRNRYKDVEKRPVRKNYRPYRNRAIIYTLIETGMRREAVTRIDTEDVDFIKGVITVQEKGRVLQNYSISIEGLEAIKKYIDNERTVDLESKGIHSPALFLSSSTNGNDDRLSPWSINQIWNDVFDSAGIEGKKTPHSARHAMGKYIIDKTGNLAAVQRQLGHKNAAYSMQYARVTNKEIQTILNNR